MLNLDVLATGIAHLLLLVERRKLSVSQGLTKAASDAIERLPGIGVAYSMNRLETSPKAALRDLRSAMNRGGTNSCDKPITQIHSVAKKQKRFCSLKELVCGKQLRARMIRMIRTHKPKPNSSSLVFLLSKAISKANVCSVWRSTDIRYTNS